MKKIFKTIKYLLPISVLVFLPSLASASNIYIDTNHSEFYVGDSVVFNVRIDSENKNINAVEGTISLSYPSGSVAVSSLNLSESDFSLWPQKPLLSDNLRLVSFSGGIPKGINSANAILFKIVLNLKETGRIAISPSNVSVYLNDGKGTKDVTDGKNLVIDVLPRKTDSQSADDWNSQISRDKTPSEPFEIFVGQEESVFDGKKFLSWNAIDKQSGISYYEVIEGNLPPVRSDRTYILKEQDQPTKVTIIAYDASGNARKSEYNPTTSTIFYLVLLVFVIVTIFIEFLITKIKRKKRNESI